MYDAVAAVVSLKMSAAILLTPASQVRMSGQMIQDATFIGAGLLATVANENIVRV